MPDLGFFDAVKAVWEFFFGFFPAWFSGILAVGLALFISALGIKLAQLLKSLFWPF